MRSPAAGAHSAANATINPQRAGAMARMKAMAKKANKEDSTEELVVRCDGRSIKLPRKMKLEDAIKHLQRLKEWEEETTTLYREFGGLPLDVAACIEQAYKEMFGCRPGSRRSARIGVPGGLSVYWGEYTLPDGEGYGTSSITVTDGRLVLMFKVRTTNRFAPKWEEMLDAAERKMREGGFIRGGAWRLPANFTDDPAPPMPIESAITENDLILPEHVEKVVRASIFTPIKESAKVRAAGISLRRGALLAGPYGTGKTMTAAVTARLAREHGWTFFLVEDPNTLVMALKLAREYSPAIVFCEDADGILAEDRDDEVNAILNTIDGIESKGSDLMVIMTTNHLRDVNPALLRPGRMDAVIVYEAPDADTALRLVRRIMGPEWHDGQPAEDLAALGASLAGSIPAFVREACERARLHAIAEGRDDVSAADLAAATRGIKAQERMAKVPQLDRRSPMEKAASILADALAPGRVNARQAPENAMG